MAHQRYTFGFTGESSHPLGEERFSPQNEADYERLARIAAAEAAGMDLLLDVRDIELYAHVSRKTVYRLVRRGVLTEKRIARARARGGEPPPHGEAHRPKHPHQQARPRLHAVPGDRRVAPCST